jgi:DNA-binding HxlR family transcriptional regulator
VQLEKITIVRRDEDKRRYDDACGLAHALDLIGERWAMLVLRELAYGPRRFSGLKADLPGISANVLTQRLADLEKRGIVRKVKLPPPASVQVYEATPWGLEAAPVIGRLGKWAARSPVHDPTLPMSPAALMMSFETLLDADRAAGINARFGFRFGTADYVATLHAGRIAVERGDPAGADVIFTGSSHTLAGVIHGGAPLALVGVDGDRKLAEQFRTLFPLPDKVEATGPIA